MWSTRCGLDTLTPNPYNPKTLNLKGWATLAVGKIRELTLDLPGNRIGDEGVESISKAPPTDAVDGV